MTERELIEAARAGDRNAVAELADRHTPAATRLALHLARDRADAEDAVQTGFIKAFTRLDRFDTSRPFAPWLFRIVANECRKQHRDASFRWRFWRARQRPEASEETTEGAVIVRLDHEALYAALRRLRHDDRALLTLSYFEGWSEADLAAMLEVPRGTVKSRKHAALQRLRRELGDQVNLAAGDVKPEVAP